MPTTPRPGALLRRGLLIMLATLAVGACDVAGPVGDGGQDEAAGTSRTPVETVTALEVDVRDLGAESR